MMMMKASTNLIIPSGRQDTRFLPISSSSSHPQTRPQRSVQFQEPTNSNNENSGRNGEPKMIRRVSTTTTASIPIGRTTSISTSMRTNKSNDHDHQLQHQRIAQAQAEYEAEYQDYRFFSRLVEGITSRQNSLVKDNGAASSYFQETTGLIVDQMIKSRQQQQQGRVQVQISNRTSSSSSQAQAPPMEMIVTPEHHNNLTTIPTSSSDHYHYIEDYDHSSSSSSEDYDDVYAHGDYAMHEQEHEEEYEREETDADMIFDFEL